MEQTILTKISDILISQNEVLKIPLRQRAKFEGWLKFQLAHSLEEFGMVKVEVESSKYFSRDRTDITFFHNENLYSIELKTPNSNWRINGIVNAGRPITKNIQSIIDDTKKLNSANGIVAFVLFPVPSNDNSWKKYIHRISENTGLQIDFSKNCKVIELNVDSTNRCSAVICAFRSKKLIFSS